MNRPAGRRCDGYWRPDQLRLQGRSTPGWVDRLRLMAAEAMARYEAYQRLLEDLHGEVKPRPAPEKNED